MAKEFRICVGVNAEQRSLSFKVSRHRADVYLTCREIPGMKHSLHASGNSRFAEDRTDPRPPIESAYLLKIRPGQFWTVARILLTTHTSWNPSRGKIPNKNTTVPPPKFQHVALVSLGFTCHHPMLHPATYSDKHKGILEVTPKLYMTATVEEIPLPIFLNHIIEHHAPDSATSFIIQKHTNKPDLGRHDELIHFITKLKTFFYWAHHNIPDDMPDWHQAQPISRRIQEAWNMSKSGITIGQSIAETVARFGLEREPHREPTT